MSINTVQWDYGRRFHIWTVMVFSRCSWAGISPVRTDAPNDAPVSVGEQRRNLPQIDAGFDFRIMEV